MGYRYFLHLAYNGKDFFGWQIQKNGPSVQEAINIALGVYFRQNINVVGCGRTDAGVHARNFYAHFNLSEQIKQNNISKAIKSLNGLLPNSIVLYDIFRVKPDANTRFDAISRTYQYQIILGKDPFYSQLAHSIYRLPDIDKMNQAAQLLCSMNDFTSFSKLHTQVKNNLCTLTKAEWNKEDGRIVFTITANRFLRNMVRSIVGTLLEVGWNKIEPNEILNIANKKDRSAAGPSVPAQGLYLIDVSYPSDIFLSLEA